MAINSADRLYEDIRQDETDVSMIARQTGWKPSNIAKVKHHLFVEAHSLDQYEGLGVPAVMARFDSDEAIAESWLSLKAGN